MVLTLARSSTIALTSDCESTASHSAAVSPFTTRPCMHKIAILPSILGCTFSIGNLLPHSYAERVFPWGRARTENLLRETLRPRRQFQDEAAGCPIDQPGHALFAVAVLARACWMNCLMAATCPGERRSDHSSKR